MDTIGPRFPYQRMFHGHPLLRGGGPGIGKDVDQRLGYLGQGRYTHLVNGTLAHVYTRWLFEP